MSKESRRLRRQFDALGRSVPPSRWIVDRLLRDGMRIIRLPVALLLLIGGVFSILPVLGLWMLPLGLMLLAVDIPFLRPSASGALIRFRRRLRVWRHKRRSR